jgi:hypothetical protein
MRHFMGHEPQMSTKGKWQFLPQMKAILLVEHIAKSNYMILIQCTQPDSQKKKVLIIGGWGRSDMTD